MALHTTAAIELETETLRVESHLSPLTHALRDVEAKILSELDNVFEDWSKVVITVSKT